MPVTCQTTKTLYFPIPKVACTSLKKRFWELKNGRSFPNQKTLFRRVRRHLGIPMAEVRIQSEVGYETVDFNSLVELPAGFESLAIVRDPVARLKSAWSNKVRENFF